jgi:hypothetical protein
VLGSSVVSPTFISGKAGLRPRERLGDVDRLLDRVADPLRRARVLEVGRIAEQRPAGPRRPAEEAPHQRLGRHDDVGDHLGALEHLRLDQLREAAQELDIAALSLRLGSSGELRVPHGDQQMVAVLHRGAARELVLVDLEGGVAVVGNAAPVGEEEGDLSPLGPLLLDTELPRDRRAAAIGPEHPLRPHPLAALEDDAGNRIIIRALADQVDDPLTQASLGSGRQRGVDDRRVERGPPRDGHAVVAVDRRVEARDLVPEADEPARQQRKLVGGAQRVHDPELLEPREGIRIDPVSGDRLAREGVPVDHQDVPAALGQRQSKRPPSAPRADDDRVFLHERTLRRMLGTGCESAHSASRAERASAGSR